jgi:putative SOS response-associated peptidase YedK
MPAAGFYEWQVQADGTKQPYYIQPAGDGEVFSIAALWDWKLGVRDRTRAALKALELGWI